MALVPLALGLLLFTYFTFRLWYSWVTLPPWSFETEGRHVGFGLQLIMYLYIAPVSCSFCLAGFLVHPTLFKRIYILVRALSALLFVGGISAIILVVGYIVLRGSLLLILLLGITPIWTLPLLAYLSYTRANEYSDFESKTLEVPESKANRSGSILTLIGGALMITSQVGLVPMFFMFFLALPTNPSYMQSILLEGMAFIFMYSAIPVVVGVILLIASFTSSEFDSKTGSILAIVFGLPSFFGLSSILGSILALVGGSIGLYTAHTQTRKAEHPIYPPSY